MVFVSLYALASVMAMQGLSRFFVAGVTLAACCLAMLVGSALARTAYFWSAMGPYVRLAMSAYYAVVLVDLACTAWRLTVRGPQGGAEAFDATGQHETLEESISRRMGALAQRFGLTSRESEVCTYLWRGYNSGHIAKALLISGNTARTHIRNIYRKLDVSSRGELLALLSEATDTEERK